MEKRTNVKNDEWLEGCGEGTDTEFCGLWPHLVTNLYRNKAEA